MSSSHILDERPDFSAPSPGLDTVLIAEDDPVFRHLLETWLQRWKYRVVALDNGLDAWKILEAGESPANGNSGLDDAGHG